MTVDLSKLPPPDLVEVLDFATLLAERKEALIALYPADEQDAIRRTLQLESEPMVRLLRENTYRELILRQRINDAAAQVMLAYATGTNLEHLAALFGVAKLEDEQDDRLRARTQLSLEGYSTAGPVLSYAYHALSSDPAVRDVSVSSPQPGTVRVTVLAEPSDEHVNGVPSAVLQAAVLASVAADDVRPLTDTVEVAPAEVITYTTRADLVIGTGPDAAIVLAAANAAHDRYVEQQFRLGYDVTVSGLHAALHQAGVSRVDLLSPAGNLAIAAHQAARCIGRDIRVSGEGV